MKNHFIFTCLSSKSIDFVPYCHGVVICILHSLFIVLCKVCRWLSTPPCWNMLGHKTTCEVKWKWKQNKAERPSELYTELTCGLIDLQRLSRHWRGCWTWSWLWTRKHKNIKTPTVRSSERTGNTSFCFDAVCQRLHKSSQSMRSTRGQFKALRPAHLTDELRRSWQSAEGSSPQRTPLTGAK